MFLGRVDKNNHHQQCQQ